MSLNLLIESQGNIVSNAHAGFVIECKVVDHRDPKIHFTDFLTQSLRMEVTINVVLRALSQRDKKKRLREFMIGLDVAVMFPGDCQCLL